MQRWTRFCSQSWLQSSLWLFGREARRFGAASEIVQDLDTAAWHCPSAGKRMTGARLHDRAISDRPTTRLAFTITDAFEAWTRGLLTR